MGLRVAEVSSLMDVSDKALNVVVQGDTVLIVLPGQEIVLGLADARRSLQRLSDAIAIIERAEAAPSGPSPGG